MRRMPGCENSGKSTGLFGQGGRDLAHLGFGCFRPVHADEDTDRFHFTPLFCEPARDWVAREKGRRQKNSNTTTICEPNIHRHETASGKCLTMK